MIWGLNPSLRPWCDLWLLHFLSCTFGPIAARPVAHCTINTIHTPIQRIVAGKAALIVCTMARRDFSANTYFSP
ncbi:MAG: hypothetical protein WBH05_01900, partial [Syntrophobacteria bacterium]